MLLRCDCQVSFEPVVVIVRSCGAGCSLARVEVGVIGVGWQELLGNRIVTFGEQG